eukprot:scaffold23306_cov125-Isochrysis_galbana.AAC.8
MGAMIITRWQWQWSRAMTSRSSLRYFLIPRHICCTSSGLTPAPTPFTPDPRDRDRCLPTTFTRTQHYISTLHVLPFTLPLPNRLPGARTSSPRPECLPKTAHGPLTRGRRATSPIVPLGPRTL